MRLWWTNAHTSNARSIAGHNSAAAPNDFAAKKETTSSKQAKPNATHLGLLIAGSGAIAAANSDVWVVLIEVVPYVEKLPPEPYAVPRLMADPRVECTPVAYIAWTFCT
jgi:hypothetical protein